MATDKKFIVNFPSFHDEKEKELLQSPPQNVYCERDQNGGNPGSASRKLANKFSWTWKCWARSLLEKVCLARSIKHVTILLFLFCAFLLIVFLLLGLGDNNSIQYSSKQSKVIGDKSQISNHDLKGYNKDNLNLHDLRQKLFIADFREDTVQNDQDVDKQLKVIFHRIDVDEDNRVGFIELEDWIQKNVEKHLNENPGENQNLFNFLDKNKDGIVCWKEYSQEFLKSNIGKHMGDTQEKDQLLIRQKLRWSGTDRTSQDKCLNLDEFRDFRHPEQSRSMLERVCNDILDELDGNTDGFLSEYEFSSMTDGGNEVGEPGDLARREKKWRNDRRLEFRQIVDADSDGLVTKEELMKYVDPRHPSHARNEARHLVYEADTDKDSWLSLAEILDKKQLFLTSKLVDVAGSFHDEF